MFFLKENKNTMASLLLSINPGFDLRLRVAQAIKNSTRNSGYFLEDSRERERERCIIDESLAKR